MNSGTPNGGRDPGASQGGRNSIAGKHGRYSYGLQRHSLYQRPNRTDAFAEALAEETMTREEERWLLNSKRERRNAGYEENADEAGYLAKLEKQMAKRTKKPKDDEDQTLSVNKWRKSTTPNANPIVVTVIEEGRKISPLPKAERRKAAMLFEDDETLDEETLTIEEELWQLNATRERRFAGYFTPQAGVEQSTASTYLQFHQSTTRNTEKDVKIHRDHRSQKPQHFYNLSNIFQGSGDGSDPSSDSTVKNSGGDEESFKAPDMSWAFEKSSGPSSDETVIPEKTPEEELNDSEKFYEAMKPTILMMTVLSRLPFKIYIDKESRIFQSKPQDSTRRAIFTIINLGLLVALLISIFSVRSIVADQHKTKNTSSNITDDYLATEKLLFQKHWLTYAVFFSSMLITSVGGLIMSLQSRRIMNYMNDFSRCLVSLSYFDLTSGIWGLGVILAVTMIVISVLYITLVCGNWLGAGEANRLVSDLLLRWYQEEAYFNGSVQVGQYFVMLLQLYALFSAWCTIAFVLMFTRGLTNAAHHWNTRISLILEKYIPTPEETRLLEIRSKLRYKKVLADHYMIAELVRKITNTFKEFTVMYIAIQTLMIAAFLYNIALVFLLSQEKLKGLTTNTGISYIPGKGVVAFEAFSCLFVCLIPFLVFLLMTSAVGETVMNGHGPVRRYGLLLAKNPKERKFIWSLTMSFTACKPHIIEPYGLFRIDRPMIGALIMTSLMIFSIMIQLQVVGLVNVSILRPCPDNPNRVCADTAQTNEKTGDSAKKVADDAADEARKITYPTPTPERPRLRCSVSKKPPKPTWPVNQTAASLPEKIHSCGYFCHGTQIFRFSLFDSNGTRRNKKHDKPKDGCMYHRPSLPTGSVYDCFGDKYNKEHVDNCTYSARKTFLPTAFDQVLEKQETSKLVAVKASTDNDEEFKSKCYMPVVGKIKHNEFPLMQCQIPWTVMRRACSKTKFDPDASYFDTISTYFDKRHLFGEDKDENSTKPDYSIEYTQGGHCITTDLGKLDLFNTPELVESFNYTCEKKALLIHRFVPYTATGIIKTSRGIKIPIGGLDQDDLDQKMFTPYAFIHPNYMGKYTPPKGQAFAGEKRHISYGYFDCFKKPLIVYDGLFDYSLKLCLPDGQSIIADCGGLPFWVYDNKTEVPGLREPKVITVTAAGKTFKCYEEWGTGQECGVKKGEIDFLIHRCLKWKEYLMKVQVDGKKFKYL